MFCILDPGMFLPVYPEYKSFKQNLNTNIDTGIQIHLIMFSNMENFVLNVGWLPKKQKKRNNKRKVD